MHKLGSWQEGELHSAHTENTVTHTEARKVRTGGSVHSNIHTVHHTFETLHTYHKQLAQEGRGGQRRAQEGRAAARIQRREAVTDDLELWPSVRCNAKVNYVTLDIALLLLRINMGIALHLKQSIILRITLYFDPWS